jgi:peptidylprolyl isomerase domain and WD repeat-containing protein 1
MPPSYRAYPAGGASIWGAEFEDEISRSVRFDRPFTVGMANAGPGTNGSQWFITTEPTPWLDGKHTIFGRAVRGLDVVKDIEGVKVNNADKPLEPIKIIAVDIK